jgi:hypothetical protein
VARLLNERHAEIKNLGDTMSKQTPFYPKRTLSMNASYNRLERDLFSPWLSFYSGKEISVTNCEGKEVYLAGVIEYGGSLQETFWSGFFEPDFKRVITEQIDQTVKDCEGDREFTNAALKETADLLRVFSRKVYQRMAEIDGRIRGNGDPNMVERRPVEDKIKALNADIDVSIEEAKKRLKSSLRWHWLRPWQFAS